VLSEYCFPFVKPGGSVYAYKTLNAASEIEDSRVARQLLGGAADVEARPTGRVIGSTESRLAGKKEAMPGGTAQCRSGHSIMVLNKIRHTPSTYPRKAGTPNRVPL
jgi:16S rRNA (guanine527-N7)-methyltransferase